MKELKPTLKNKINSAFEKISGGIAQVASGCKSIVECLDEDRSETVKLLELVGVYDDFIDLIERVGRGRLSPRLLFLPGPGAERLQRVPIADQERLLNVGVVVAKQTGKDFKKIVKPIAQLTNEEALLAINSNGNVPFETQVDTLKQVMVRKTFNWLPFTLDGDTLLARSNCRIPFAELESLYHRAAKAHEQKLKRLQNDMNDLSKRRSALVNL